MRKAIGGGREKKERKKEKEKVALLSSFFKTKENHTHTHFPSSSKKNKKTGKVFYSNFPFLCPLSLFFGGGRCVCGPTYH